MAAERGSDPPNGGVESRGLLDDSDMPDRPSERNLHLYELTSFDMLVLFVAMSCILACLAQFHAKPVAVFCINLGLIVLVRIFTQPLIQHIALCVSSVLYSCIIGTESTSIGPTINFFWPIPFMFILTGFRFIILCSMAIFVLFVHIFYVQFTEALYFNMDTRRLPFSLDMVFFLVNLLYGICIYSLFFVLGQTAWRLKEFPHESLDVAPLLEDDEMATFALLPMGLLLGQAGMMSEEQHLVILLRLAQQSPYRDLLLQLMRPTKRELTSRFGDKLEATQSTASLGMLSTRGKSKRSFVSHSSAPRSSTSESFFQTQSSAATAELGRGETTGSLSVPVISEEKDAEYENLRTFLRSALCQLILETHPNRIICNAVLAHRDFHCSRQQIEAALTAFNLKSQRSRIYSPRLQVNSSVMRLWSSINRYQREGLPPNSHELLLPGFLSAIPRAEYDRAPSGRQSRLPKIGKVYSSISLVKRKLTLRTNIKLFAEDFEEGQPEMTEAKLKKKLTKQTTFQSVASSCGFRLRIIEPTCTRRSFTRRRPSGVRLGDHQDLENHDGTIIRSDTTILSMKIGETGCTKRRRRHSSILSLVSLVQNPEIPCWKSSLMIAILGLEQDETKWILKDRVGFLSESKAHVTQLSEVGSQDLSYAQEQVAKSETKSEIRSEYKSEIQSDAKSEEMPVRKHRRRRRSLGRKREKFKTVKQPRLTPLEGHKRMDKWQFLQHCISSVFTFRLLSPIRSTGVHLRMPRRQSGGVFHDLKIERWYLSWLSYVEAFMVSKMRITFIVFTFISISLTIFEIVLHYMISSDETFARSSELTFIWLSVSVCVLQILLSCRIFYQLRPSNFGDRSTSHLFKLRTSVLAIVLVGLSLVDFFVNPASAMFNVGNMTDLQVVYLISLRSVKEINLHCTLIILPLFCLCTEPSMVYLIAVIFLLLFIICPLVGYFCETWPILILASVQETQTSFAFHAVPPPEEQPTRSEALWSNYFSLFHQFGPSLFLLYVIERAIQGTLRKVFGRHAFFYLLYLDALSPIKNVEEESTESEPESSESEVSSEGSSNGGNPSPLRSTAEQTQRSYSFQSKEANGANHRAEIDNSAQQSMESESDGS